MPLDAPYRPHPMGAKTVAFGKQTTSNFNLTCSLETFWEGSLNKTKQNFLLRKMAGSYLKLEVMSSRWEQCRVSLLYNQWFLFCFLQDIEKTTSSSYSTAQIYVNQNMRIIRI